MNKKWWILIITAIIVLFCGLIWKLNKPTYFVEENLTFNGNVVINSTIYHDTILHYSLKEADIKNQIIYVEDLKNVEESTKGAVGTYKDVLVLFLRKNMTQSDALDIIPHEVIHIKQIVDGDLFNINKNNVIYKGEKHILTEIEYELRPWEIDAYNDAPKLRKKVLENAKN